MPHAEIVKQLACHIPQLVPCPCLCQLFTLSEKWIGPVIRSDYLRKHWSVTTNFWFLYKHLASLTLFSLLIFISDSFTLAVHDWYRFIRNVMVKWKLKYTYITCCQVKKKKKSLKTTSFLFLLLHILWAKISEPKSLSVVLESSWILQTYGIIRCIWNNTVFKQTFGIKL